MSEAPDDGLTAAFRSVQEDQPTVLKQSRLSSSNPGTSITCATCNRHDLSGARQLPFLSLLYFLTVAQSHCLSGNSSQRPFLELYRMHPQHGFSNYRIQSSSPSGSHFFCLLHQSFDRICRVWAQATMNGPIDAHTAGRLLRNPQARSRRF